MGIMECEVRHITSTNPKERAVPLVCVERKLYVG